MGKSRETIDREAKKLGLTKPQEKWSKDEEDILRENYPDKDISYVYSLLPNRTHQAIQIKANKLGLHRNFWSSAPPKHTCNYDYFKTIDTPNKAYFLGWAMTDGNISGSQYRLRVSEKDKDILHKFRTDIKSNHNIYTYGNNVEIVITNRIFTNNLIDKGCTPRKTKTLKFPNITEEYIWDFIKGAFDGDGNYCITEKTKKIGFVSASFVFITSINQILNDNSINTSLYSYDNHYVLVIQRNNAKCVFLSYMLNTKSDFLDRKLEKMQLLYEHAKRRLTVKSA